MLVGIVEKMSGENGQQSANGESDLRANNLEQLLQRTIALQGDNPDDQNGSAPLNPQDAEWLKEALANSFSDPVKEMAKVVHELSQLLDTSPSTEETLERIGALGDLLQDYVVDIDLANNFIKMGGLNLIKICLDRDEESIKVCGCQICGDLAQNNEFSQAAIISHESLFNTILSMVKSPSENSEARIKALYALSALVREAQQSQQVLMSHEGHKVLIAALKSDVLKLKIKAVFLIQSSVEWSTDWHIALLHDGLIETLIDEYRKYYAVERDDNPFCELILKTLTVFSEVVPEHTKPKLKNSELGLKAVLQNGQQFISQQPSQDPFLINLWPASTSCKKIIDRHVRSAIAQLFPPSN